MHLFCLNRLRGLMHVDEIRGGTFLFEETHLLVR